MQRMTHHRLLYFFCSFSLFVCGYVRAASGSFNLRTILAGSQYGGLSSQTLAVIVDLSTDPGAFFKPEFVAQSLGVYDIVFQEIKDDRKTVTGVVSIPPSKFQTQFRPFLAALNILQAQRVTVYRQYAPGGDFIIDRERILVKSELHGLFDYYPESYFFVKEDTQYITNKLEKKPGTSGSISMPE